MSAEFNNELLLLARHYRGMSQAEVAEASGLDQGHYSKIERGILNAPPRVESIEAVAKALNFPVSYFLQNDELSGLPLSVHEAAWRKRASVAAADMKRLHAELNIRLMHVRRYLQAVDVDGELPLPKLDPDDMGGAEKVAQFVRRAWMAPPGPIKNLTSLCERAGILVVHCDFVEKIDGVTMRLRDVPPIIFLNKSAPPDRMRHSLAHELGHLIMHTVPSDQMEDEADSFAGELLAPMNELRSDLIGGRPSLERFVQLKKFWKVSVASLVYRAKKYGYLTDNQSDYLWRQISMRGWRKREPDETQFLAETPSLYQHVIDLHEKDLGFDVNDFAKMLHISINDVRNLYGIASGGGPRRHLSLVK
ncbi:XRE family transcriptional regulator [Methylobacterium sp. E-005]|uniref:helix-turn-helix domain-containing protein n=1 Tax=Methylobacterium sp. E-005 TaxID=2836549 RepID=UPI001FBAB5F2|nr:XRE family transcriptional regulator [Methylobacterium sp. E-005]MCJ2089920.1 XRE family transcriptional regulator [Methylobacterium sp. E-005]